ncbi:KptA family-domain-containing protein [Xylariaceae sp. FL0594]|nr:KptA family-domain-containing protein [Xylariaceae sp. FL0594]
MRVSCHSNTFTTTTRRRSSLEGLTWAGKAISTSRIRATTPFHVLRRSISSSKPRVTYLSQHSFLVTAHDVGRTARPSTSHHSARNMADQFQDVTDVTMGNDKRRGGGGARGGGRGGNRQVNISRALSTLLRHQAQNAGIALDAEGFAPLDKVMQWPRLRSLNPTVAEIKEEVATNAKQRFSLKPNPDESISSSTTEEEAAHWVIRANQGHTIQLASEALHTSITLEAGNVPPVVVHGTYFAFWPAIVASGGLKKMGRTHVHFGTGLPSGEGEKDGQVHDEADEDAASGSGSGSAPKVISGMRSDAEVLIFIDIERALRDSAENPGPDGIKWWMSENNVVLTEGNVDGVVPLKYFKEVRGRRQGVGLLWKDGEKVADLPDSVVARIPHGKGRGGGAERGRGGRRGRGRGRG